MKLLLISGNTIACYINKERKEVYNVNWEDWAKEGNIPDMIEALRIGNIK